MAECRRCHYDLQAVWAFCGECGLAVGKKATKKGVHLPNLAQHRHESMLTYGKDMSRPRKKAERNQQQSSRVSRSKNDSALTKNDSARIRRLEHQPTYQPDPHLEAAAELLEKHKTVLATVLTRNAKQERVIALLESSNEAQRESNVPKRDLLLSNPSPHVALMDPRQGPQRLPAPPREATPKPLSYQEWHLKTVYGVHDFPTLVRASLDEQATNAALAHCGTRSDFKEEEENGSIFSAGLEFLSHTEKKGLRSSALSSRGGENRPRGGSSGSGGELLRQAVASAPVVVTSLNPIKVAPGTPLTGPQSLPTTLTNALQGATQQLQLLSKHEALNLLDTQQKGNRSSSSRGHSASWWSGAMSVGGVENVGQQLESQQESGEEEAGVETAWFWGAASPPLLDHSGGDSARSIGSAASESLSTGGWGEEGAVARGKGRRRSGSGGGGGGGGGGVRANISNKSCGIFWRGDESAQAVYRKREEEDEAAAAAAAAAAMGGKSQEEERALGAATLTSKDEGEGACPPQPPELELAVSGGGSSVVNIRGGDDDEEELHHDDDDDTNDDDEKSDRRTRDDDDDDDDDGSSAPLSSERALGVLHATTANFLSKRISKQRMKELRTLKRGILQCFRSEVDLADSLASLTKDVEQRKSLASVAVADTQFKVATEHAKLMVLDAKLAKLRFLEDEFTAKPRGEKDLEVEFKPERKLLKRKAAVGAKVSQAEARLATALASESRVHGECLRELHRAKVRSMAAKHDTVAALKAREDAVYALHVAVRHAAALRLQRFVRSKQQQELGGGGGGGGGRLYLLSADDGTGESLTNSSTTSSSALTVASTVKQAQQQQQRQQRQRETASRKANRKSALLRRAVRHGAALRIQQAVRRRQARKRLQERAQVVYTRLHDPVSGKAYYWNSLKATVEWEKPWALMGDGEDKEGEGDEEGGEDGEGEFHKEDYEDDDEQSFVGGGQQPSSSPPLQRSASVVPAPTSSNVLEAACTLQRVWRSARGWRKTVSLVKARYEKLFDEASGNFYYWDLEKGEAQWNKPRVLGDKEDVAFSEQTDGGDAKPTPRTPLRPLHLPETPEEAARMLQRVFRTRVAWVAVVKRAKAQYEKLYDPDTGEFYYWNLKTGEAMWTKPKVLGAADVELTVDSEDSPKPSPRVVKTPRPLHLPETPKEAASMLQRVYRSKLAKRRCVSLTKAIYEKIIDDGGSPYYFNSATGQSQWHKPKIFGLYDDAEVASAESGDSSRSEAGNSAYSPEVD